MPHLFFTGRKGAAGIAGGLVIAISLLIFSFPFGATAATNYSCPPGQTYSSAGNSGAGGCVSTPGSNNSGNGGGAPSGGSAAGTAVGGAIGCTVQLFGTLAFSLASVALTTGGAVVPGYPVVADAGAHLQNEATGISNNSILGINVSEIFTNQFLACITRTIARAALQQIAVSTINWINSGFNGNPSFVQNYDQFFTNIADQTAGSFIQGSNLAFLCSPFALQVKIAIATAYAGENQTPSCSITQIVSNYDAFVRRFNQGGWQAFLSITTTQTNNPEGAFLYGQAQLASAVNNAQGKKAFDLQTNGGFLSFQQEKNCKPYGPEDPVPTIKPGQQRDSIGDIGGEYQVCDLVTTTPGTAISQSLDKTLGINTESLINAKYFDEIISALVSQLIQKTLYNGLSTISSGQGYGYNNYGRIDIVPLQRAVEANVPVYGAAAQQVISIDTQNTANIQGALSSLQTLKQCWQSAAATSTATSTPLTPAQMAQAQANVSSTQALIDEWNGKLLVYEQSQATASSSIQTLNNYQTAVNSTTDPSQLQTLVNEFTTDAANNLFPGTSAVNDAQEDQALLQSNLSTLNSQTQTGQNQCNAFP